jgi:hypothetical protein
MDRSNPWSSAELEDVPNVFGSMAELAAGNAGTEVKLANSDAVVFDVVGKVVIAFGHGTYEYCDALALVEIANVVADTYDLGVEAKRNLAAVGGKVIGDRVLDDFDELFLRRRRPDLMSVQELDHESSEPLEGTRNAHCRADPDEHILGRVDVDLELARLVDGRIE